MNKVIYIGFFLSLVVLTTLDGCYYDNRDDLYPMPVDTSATFSGDIEPFISGSCADGASCHGAGATNPEFTSYDKIVNNINRIQVRAIDEQTMPPAGPANQAQLDKLQRWIEDGKPNN